MDRVTDDQAPAATPKTIPASFRLSSGAHAKLYGQAAAAGISTRAWLEHAVLENATQIVARPQLHPDLGELLLQVNKAGNNVNQLAHRFNTLALKGDVPGSEVTAALEALREISRALQETVRRAG